MYKLILNYIQKAFNYASKANEQTKDESVFTDEPFNKYIATGFMEYRHIWDTVVSQRWIILLDF